MQNIHNLHFQKSTINNLGCWTKQNKSYKTKEQRARTNTYLRWKHNKHKQIRTYTNTQKQITRGTTGYKTKQNKTEITPSPKNKAHKEKHLQGFE